MTYENIIVDQEDGVGIVTLNRPDVLNALSSNLLLELDDAVTDLEQDDDVRAIIFTGSGDRAFSAGADIHEMTQMAEASKPPTSDSKREQHSWHLASCVKPTIGAINGLAYGGGAVMAASFDIRVGSERTSFRFLAASYGRVNSTWNLPMQIGWPMAKELLFTARVVEAREAFQVGLLNHLVASDQLILKAIGIAKQIAANDPRMVQGIKELMIQNVGAIWDQMFRREGDARAGKLKGTPVAEGFKDFLDRKGRK